MDFLSAAYDAAAQHPEVAYGAMARSLALVYCLVFVSWLGQAACTVGPKGAYPAKNLLAAAKTKLPLLRRLQHTSSVFAAGSSLIGVRVVFVAAAAAAAAPPYSRACFVLCWAVSHSTHAFFPWDTLLAEFGFLAIFLPVVPTLDPSAGWQGIAVQSLPSPALAFALRRCVGGRDVCVCVCVCVCLSLSLSLSFCLSFCFCFCFCLFLCLCHSVSVTLSLSLCLCLCLCVYESACLRVCM